METAIESTYNEKRSIKIQKFSLLAGLLLLVPYTLYVLLSYKIFAISRVIITINAIIEIVTSIFIIKYKTYYFQFTIIKGYRALFWGYLKILLEIFVLWLLFFNQELLLTTLHYIIDLCMNSIFGYSIPIILNY